MLLKVRESFLVFRVGVVLATFDTTVKVVQRLKSRSLVPQDVALDPPRQSLGSLVAHELSERNGKDVIQLFKCPLLGLGNLNRKRLADVVATV